MATFGERVYEGDGFGLARYHSNDKLTAAIARVAYRRGVLTNTSAGIW